ncbi:MAG: sigma-70 family RNA polymerase sigma factor [bacterium]
MENKINKTVKKSHNKKGTIHIASLDSCYNFSLSIFSNPKTNYFQNEDEPRLSNNEILEYIELYKETKNQELFISKIYPLFTKVINKIVYRFKESSRDIALEDLVQCGYLGLIKAIENIDINYVKSNNLNPITFIYSYIEGEIRHYIRDKTEFIKIPRTIKKLYYQIHNLLSQNPNLTIFEISEKLNIREETVIEILNLPVKKHIDINKVKSKKLKDFDLSIEDKILLEQVFEKLTNFEKTLFNLLFDSDLTKVEIAQKLNITRKKLYDILNSIKNKLNQKIF